MDCGAACLRMICAKYGRHYLLETLRQRCDISRAGSSMLGLSYAAESLGLKTLGVRASIQTLCEVPLPCIVHWKQKHFVVVYRIDLSHKSRRMLKNGDNCHDLKGSVLIADPAIGLVKCKLKDFLDSWISNVRDGREEGVALLIEPTPEFYVEDGEPVKRSSLLFMLKYVKPYGKLFFQLLFGLLLGTALQMIAPLLTQSVVDVGIGNKDINFVVLILIAQLVLYIAQASVEFIRSWILLHISTRINISLISDFLIKLMKLPLSFFDTKMIGDIMQRIGDHDRIRNFLTVTSLNTLFSMLNLVVFSIVLVLYSLKLFAVFIVSSVLYVGWVLLFMRRRKTLDYKRFALSSEEQGKLYQMVYGMQEIKLNNCERQKRWEWEHIQASLFNVGIGSLSLSQYQKSGAVFINEIKNILVSFLSAKAVIDGELTIGMMMAVSYIIGQLNSPVTQIIGFLQSAQDAKVSMERLSEIHNREDEENLNDDKVGIPQQCHTIEIKGVSFRYNKLSDYVLKNVNLTIPQGKVTAIVGVSGSGKTTLVKMLLGFYSPNEGRITVGGSDLWKIRTHVWRKACGAVMQDGFIFSDSIAKNIAIGDDVIDENRLLDAARKACIMDFVKSQPLGFNTKIGAEGKGISHGQKQRILIARAIYKNPEFLFLDEATNSLDANNERTIMENMDSVFCGKTVVVVAHRLSTVRNADNIVVLSDGSVIEQGTHDELIRRKGEYYKLVRNQLELGL